MSKKLWDILKRTFVYRRNTSSNIIDLGVITKELTRDEARAARDAERPAYRAKQTRMKELNSTIYVNGNYNPDLSIEHRSVLLDELNTLSSSILVSARQDRAYNDIIAYRPDANVDPDNWEAVDKQEWKREKAITAQVFLASRGAA